MAAINYRYSTQAIYPAPMHDGARAVQFLRMKPAEWNLDAARIGATGGSAGACMSLWIGFHDDLAEADSADAVRRQSSRLRVMGVNGAQTVLDFRLIRDMIGDAASRHPAGPKLFGVSLTELLEGKADRLTRDASPATHLTKDDPPAYLFYSEARGPLPPGRGIRRWRTS
ncbi:MAG: alpha/beta hydrolase fold domain-containing protein [Acidobacteriia bacterium]|nr:alpha/beta hydrolase fold domain-containing protein [Terriglobia bacterium]